MTVDRATLAKQLQGPLSFSRNKNFDGELPYELLITYSYALGWMHRGGVVNQQKALQLLQAEDAAEDPLSYVRVGAHLWGLQQKPLTLLECINPFRKKQSSPESYVRGAVFYDTHFGNIHDISFIPSSQRAVDRTLSKLYGSRVMDISRDVSEALVTQAYDHFLEKSTCVNGDLADYLLFFDKGEDLCLRDQILKAFPELKFPR